MTEKLKKLNALFSRRAKFSFAGLFFMMLIGTALELIGVGAIPAFLATMVTPNRILEVPVVGSIFTHFDIQGEQRLLIYTGLGLLAIYIIKNAYLGFLNYFKSKFIRDQKIVLARRLYTAYMRAPYAFHLNRNTAELLRNANLEVRIIGNEVLRPLLQLILSGVTASAITILLIVIEPVISVVVVGVLGMASFIFTQATRKKIEAMGEEEQRQRTASYKVMHEGFGSLKAVKVLNKEGSFIRKFMDSFRKANHAQHLQEIIGSWTRPFMEVIAITGLLIVVFFIIYLGEDVSTLIPTLGLFGVAILKLQTQITTAVSSFNSLKYSNYAVDPVYDDLNLLEPKLETEQTTEKERPTIPLQFNSELRIDSLYFRYQNSETDVLKNINMTIQSGSSVGLVGKTGAGKSTLVDILLGLLEPTRGQVTVDDTPVFHQLAQWQLNIGYIPQDIYLLDDTIKRNIALGLDDEAIDENRLQEAISIAQIQDLIASLPEGWDTTVGERGVRLSGGQLQRVGMARALYTDPDVLVMDEATSSLDSSTEQSVMQALDRAKQGRTFIMIAHRMSTVKKCDVIYMLEEGELIASGTYSELLENSSEFRTMVADTE